MCETCNKARTLPRQKALALIAQAYQNRMNTCPHLDALIGELVGEPTPKADPEVEAAWESKRRS